MKFNKTLITENTPISSFISLQKKYEITKCNPSDNSTALLNYSQLFITVN